MERGKEGQERGGLCEGEKSRNRTGYSEKKKRHGRGTISALCAGGEEKQEEKKNERERGSELLLGWCTLKHLWVVQKLCVT